MKRDLKAQLVELSKKLKVHLEVNLDTGFEEIEDTLSVVLNIYEEYETPDGVLCQRKACHIRYNVGVINLYFRQSRDSDYIPAPLWDEVFILSDYIWDVNNLTKEEAELLLIAEPLLHQLLTKIGIFS